jgi:hypothetical protein
MFAKLFDRPAYGQVLALLSEDDDGAPEIQWYAQPTGMGVCMFGVSYTNDDEGKAAAEAAFAGMNDTHADAAASALFNFGG